MSDAPPITKIPFRVYSEKALRVKRREGGGMVPARLKPIQAQIDDAVEAMHAKGQPAFVQIVKTRRGGISTYVAMRFSHRCYTRPYQDAVVISDNGVNASKIFQIYELMYEHLPGEIKPLRKGAKGQQIDLPILHSRIQVGSGESETFGRGGDSNLVHVSEAPYLSDLEEVLSAVNPGVSKTGDGIVILEGTSNGPGTQWHKLWQASEDGTSGYLPLFFSVFDDPDHRLKVAVPLDEWTEEEMSWHEQWGVDGYQIAWLRLAQQVDCMGRDDRRRREYPTTAEESFSNVGEVAWEAEEILGCFRRQEPVFEGTIGDRGLVPMKDGPLVLWEKPMGRAEYVIGADPAGGLKEREGDLSAAAIYRTGRRPGDWPIQVGEWGGHQDPITFAKTLTLIGHYFNKALLAVEITGLGIGCEAALQKTYYYPKLHRWVPPDRYKSKSDTWGWQTTWNSKNHMLGIADWLIRTKHVTMKSPALLEELLNYQEISPGQYEGTRGDDRVLASMIAWVSWAQHQFSGIPLKDIRQMLARLYGGTARIENAAHEEAARVTGESRGGGPLDDPEDGNEEATWAARVRARKASRAEEAHF